MIGFYDYTVILTYLSLLSSIFGMTQAIDGHFRTAILCLAFSGLCDMFDGKVARRKTERTDDEKLFGLQIDSLVDVVAFGVFPIMICYLLGVNSTFGQLALGYYGICSVIRLAFFNVLETNRQREESGANKYYHGLPITSIAILLPLTFLLSFIIPDNIFVLVLHALPLVVGTLFIVDFQLKKPGNGTLALIVVIVTIAVVVIALYSRFPISKRQPNDKPLLERLERWEEEYQNNKTLNNTENN